MAKIVMVAGFRERKKDAEPVLLYFGQDADEGLRVLNGPPEGIAYTQVFHNLLPWKRRVHEVPEGVVYEPAAVPDGEVLTLTVELAELKKLLDEKVAELGELKQAGEELIQAKSYIGTLECLAADRLIEIEDLKAEVVRAQEANEFALKKIVDLEGAVAQSKEPAGDLKLEGGEPPAEPKGKK